MKLRFLFILSFVILLLPCEKALARQVLVELFTSQGCSSCPPADKVLSELSEDDNVLALSFHVDYWDYIGWKDPFSDPKYTERQKYYNSSFGSRTIYTPQTVIDGVFETVGSSKRSIDSYIKKASEHQQDIPINLSVDDGAIVLDIPESLLNVNANIFLVGYDPKHETDVSKGENKGKKLANNNVVRYLKKIGQWDGNDFSAKFMPPIQDFPQNIAVIIQESKYGQVLGLATVSR